MAEPMTAVRLMPTDNGGVYEYQTVDQPVAAETEVLVRVHAAGTNRGELLMASGFKSGNPLLAGIEFAGEIAGLGADVTGWELGDRVMGRCLGSFADYVAVPAAGLMRIPPGLDFAEAAAIPNVFVTVHDSLVTNAQMQRGDTVLVTAASSGIGTATLQLARLLGAAKVFATTRKAAKSDALKRAGADVVLDVSVTGCIEVVAQATGEEGLDIIIDSVGGPMFADNLEMLAVKGRIVSVGRNAGQRGKVDLDVVANKRAQIIGVTFRTRSPAQALQCQQRFAEDCLPAFSEGALRPVVDRVFPFQDLHAAHDYMLSDQQVGKIVLARDSE